MRSLAHPLLSFVVLALAAASARAQVAIQPGLLVTRDGEELENEPFLYVTKSDCDRNATYEFTVQYATAPTVVEAWVGVNTVDCSATSNRLRASVSSTSPICKLVGRIVEPTVDASISVDAIDLFSKDTLAGGFEREYANDAGAETNRGDDRAMSCDIVVNQTYTLFFIPLPAETNGAANVGYEPLSGAGYGTLSAMFTLYTILPRAPSNLKSRAGVAAIGVGFEPLLDSIRTRYKAYFDWGSGDDQACGSGALVAGMPAPDESDTIEAVSTSTSSATLQDLDDKGILPGAEVAVSVITIDAAGNESLLSSPVCVERLARGDFIDECETESKCASDSDSCSCRVGVERRGRGVLGFGVWIVSAFVLLLRRKRA